MLDLINSCYNNTTKQHCNSFQFIQAILWEAMCIKTRVKSNESVAFVCKAPAFIKVYSHMHMKIPYNI